MIARAQIVAEALTWLDTRYRHQGRQKGVGVDCIGLIGGVALALGISEAEAWRRDRDFAGYGRVPNPDVLRSGCARYLDPVTKPQPGDILVFRFVREPQHFAILSRADPRYIIHSFLPARRVVENRVDDLWASRIVGAFAFRGAC